MAISQSHLLLWQSLFRLMAAIIMLSFSTITVFANGLAEAATNPVGNLIQLQIQYTYNWSNYESDGYSNAAIIQPVIPVKLPWEAVPLMISRTTVSAYVTTPDFGAPVGRVDGFGDIFQLSLILPKLDAKGVLIGLGPALSIPTASNDFTGSGKWEAGPAAVYFNSRIKGWQWGALGWQVWSFAGDSDREDVSKLSFQPILTRHFDKGWYAGTVDVPWSYNWETSNWVLPLGLKIGRVTKIGEQPVNLFTEVYGSPKNDGASPKWSFKLNLTFLFPNK